MKPRIKMVRGFWYVRHDHPVCVSYRALFPIEWRGRRPGFGLFITDVRTQRDAPPRTVS